MGLFNKKTIDDIYREYPTKDEYYKEIEKIQNDELKSERYVLTHAFLMNNYWNRKNINLENELFKIIGSCGLEDPLLNESYDLRSESRMKKYEYLNQFMNSLSNEQINSNIFLKNTNLFMNMSSEVCFNIIDELYDKLNSADVSDFLEFKVPIPHETQMLILNYITEYTNVKYFEPKDYRNSCISILDSEHKYVYEDYNLFVQKMGKLAEDIYFLKLNDILSNDSSIECNRLYLYHSGNDNHFIVNFFIVPKQEISYNKNLEYVLK